MSDNVKLKPFTPNVDELRQIQSFISVGLYTMDNAPSSTMSGRVRSQPTLADRLRWENLFRRVVRAQTA